MGRLSRSASSARRAEAMLLLSQGVKVVEMATRWGLSEGGARAYLRRLGRPGKQYVPKSANANYGKQKMVGNEPDWQTADPSSLTADQLGHALRLDIKPARYAWLLQCPKGGNAGGDKRNPFLR